jgi:two-component system cell cycle sensor histidine kinase/response regulator CckA
VPYRSRESDVAAAETEPTASDINQTESSARSILAQSPDAVLVVDEHGIVASAFGPVSGHFNMTPDEIIGRNLESFLAEDCREKFASLLADCSCGTKQPISPPRAELAICQNGREKMRCEAFISRVTSVEEGAGLFSVTFQEIFPRMEFWGASQKTISLLEATLESTADGILVVSAEGKFVLANRKFAKMWNIPSSIIASGDDEQALDSVLDQLIDPEAFLGKVKELYSQPEAESLDVIHFKDGRIVERYSVPQRLAGKSIGRAWSFRDITERLRAENALKESQDQLRQAQRLEAVGQLAGGVAHDFNNLLQIIQGYSQTLKIGLDDPERILAGATEIGKAADRAAVLTRQLLAFSRKQSLHPEILDLNAMLKELDKMLGRLVPENIAISYDLEPALGRVEVDPGQIEQVIMNLVTNARDALPQGGRIRISTSTARMGPDDEASHEHVVLSISDNGCGMNAEIREHIFEPFFTTKEEGRGTGLGLATVYGIIKQSGGTISVKSHPGQGASFIISLPAIQREILPDPEPAARTRALKGTGTVLLIEDQDAVRELVGLILTELGYSVLSAGLPSEAIKIAEAHTEDINLILTDVVMPEMNGSEVAIRISSIHRNALVLYMSGYPYDTLEQHQISHEHFLAKPFSKDELADKVRELLTASTQQETVS